MRQGAIEWEAGAELTALLRRYYRGEAALWGEIQAIVHADLLRQGLPLAPRHLRFRASETGYMVIVEDAEGYASL
ncbi:hypothetical protein K2Z83_03945 [Oscillochloris sp. ZM17-4]|uniref:hypothetical protein n=1 Tax=Oscillochloris sp. ZM17-4 TaxID=2866714 RepID=UPI001C72B9D2|nr:hypothetical protein [Oscillochloris sp. ZM17-4]MBX0326834.1 hypothetical protein [Oscillochloris sp. ZM17-4]